VKFTFNRIDVPAYAGTQHGPHDIIPRETAEWWVTPQAPVALPNPIEWGFHKREDQVLVQLHPYLLPGDPALALGFMMQLGVYIAASAKNFTGELLQLHLSIGNPVNITQEQPPAWQYQVGFAFRIK